jgi:hypothetical protein
MATLLSDVEFSDTNTGTTPSFTPTADALLVAIVIGTQGGSATQTFTDSAGLTWTNQTGASAWIGGYQKAVYFSTAPVGSSPSSMTATFTSAGSDFFGGNFVVLEVEDYDSVQGVVQTFSDSGGARSGAYTGTLGASTSAGNDLIGAAVVTSSTQALTAITPGTGYTQLLEYGNGDGQLVGQVQSIDTAQSSIDWANLTSSGFGGWVVGAIEVGVDSGGGGGPVIAPLAFMHLFGTLR